MDARFKTSEIELKQTKECARILLKRPDIGNALNASMVDDLDRAIDEALESGVRLIVFEGAGRHMCTGFDLSDLDRCSDGDLLLRLVRIEQVLQKVYRCPVVTAAIGSGRVYGAGADLFAACDRRIGLPDTRFAFPGSSFGLVLGTRRFATRVGNDVAQRTLLQGADIEVQRAAQIGLVTDLVDLAALPVLLEDIRASATRLDPKTVAAVRAQTSSSDDDRDLSSLVISASRPGLKDRITAYRDRVVAAKTTVA